MCTNQTFSYLGTGLCQSGEAIHENQLLKSEPYILQHTACSPALSSWVAIEQAFQLPFKA